MCLHSACHFIACLLTFSHIYLCTYIVLYFSSIHLEGALGMVSCVVINPLGLILPSIALILSSPIASQGNHSHFHKNSQAFQ